MPKLLLADDSPTTQKVVQLTFADEGIDVVVADDGDTAMELYSHHKPDIVLADINIPGLNGYEVCEAIRKREDNGATPVILLAGSFEPFDVEKAHDVGASDYLTKPFSSIRRLVATVTALLDTAARHDEAAEETIEPNSVPPDAEETGPETIATAAPPPQSQPGPTLPPEPNPYATDDIENLIQQSFVETVEMPHTVAERMMSEIAAAKAQEETRETASSRDEVAFDDELIETTFANEPDGAIESTEPVQNETAVSESVDPSYSAESFPAEPGFSSNGIPDESVQGDEYGLRNEQFDSYEVDQGELPVEPTETAVGPNTSELAQLPTEEFQLDQSGDETYFEPEVDVSEQPSEVPTFSEAGKTGFEIVSIQAPTNDYDFSKSEAQAQSHEPEPADEATTDAIGNTTENVGEFQPPPTPWDSVAEPNSSPYRLDESNLLELPMGFANPGGNVQPDQQTEVSDAVAELAPEIVDEIARATASQISEELVREIANRIVPRVVEEVMARHKGENNEQ